MMNFMKVSSVNGANVSRQVVAAQRLLLPQTIVSQPTGQTSRAMHYAHPAGAISSLRILWANWCYNSSGAELATGNDVTVKASVEYPSGTFTQVLFGGSASGNMANGGMLTSDAVNITIPAGAQFWVRTYLLPVASPNNIPICTLPATATVLSTTDGNTNGSDATMSGTIAQSSTANCIRPTVIFGDVAARNAKAYVLAGDSICWGEGDVSTVDAKGGSGYLARALASKASYVKICRQGQGLREVFAGTTRLQALLLALRGSYTDMVCQYGVNDLRLRGNVSELQTDMQAYLALYVGVKTVCTLPPRTSSTDSWVTTGNQTQQTAPWSLTNLTSYNDWVRGLPTGVMRVADAADAVMSARNSGLWAAATPGLTTDGTHPTSVAAVTAAAYVAASLY
jgi:hypothetical protein